MKEIKTEKRNLISDDILNKLMFIKLHRNIMNENNNLNYLNHINKIFQLWYNKRDRRMVIFK